MIPYSSPEAIKITDLVNSTNVNESRYELLANDLSLSAQFDDILSGFSCFEIVTSVYSTVASHSGIWNDALTLSNLDILVRTHNLTTPNTNTIIPLWSADAAKHLDPIWQGSIGRSLTADYLTAPTKSELDNTALNWDYRIPSMQVVRAMINSTEYGTGGKTWCSQEYNLALYPDTCGVLTVYRNDVCLWKDDVPGHNVLGKENEPANTLILNITPTHGWAVGINSATFDNPVSGVGQFCYCSPEVNDQCIYDNALSAKTMYMEFHDNTPDINLNFSLKTYPSKMSLEINAAGLKSKLSNPVVILAAYNSSLTEYDDITTVATRLSINSYYNNYTSKNVAINSSMSYFPYEAKDGSGNLVLTISCIGIGGSGKTFSYWTVVNGTGSISNIRSADATFTFNLDSNSKVKIGAVFV